MSRADEIALLRLWLARSFDAASALTLALISVGDTYLCPSLQNRNEGKRRDRKSCPQHEIRVCTTDLSVYARKRHCCGLRRRFRASHDDERSGRSRWTVRTNEPPCHFQVTNVRHEQIIDIVLALRYYALPIHGRVTRPIVRGTRLDISRVYHCDRITRWPIVVKPYRARYFS